MADNLALTQSDLINRLRNGLPSGYSDSTVDKPNSHFTTPSDTKWLRVSVIPFTTISDAATGEFKITSGNCVVDCFYPKNSGDQAQLLDAHEIKILYENQTFGNAKCQEASVLNLGEDGSWYHVQININFYMNGFS